MKAIATAQFECDTVADYAFKLQCDCRICVRGNEIVAKVQLPDEKLKPT